MDKLCALSQDLLAALQNKVVAQKVRTRLEEFTQRWDDLVQKLESMSKEVGHQYSLAILFTAIQLALVTW